MPNTVLRTALSALIAVALIAALALWGGVDFDELRRTLLRLPLASFLLALAIHAAIYAARAQRFRLLTSHAERPGFIATWLVSSAHNLAVYVIPAKVGEATFPLYLKSTCGTPLATGLASLVVSRLLDLATLCGMLALITLGLVLGEQWPGPTWAALALIALLVALTLAFFGLSLRGERLIAVAQACVRLARLDDTVLGRRLLDGSSRVAEALRVAGSDGRIARALPLSIAVWLGVFAFYAVLALGFGLPEHVGFLEASFGSSFAVLTNLLPINALAGFGTQETGWVLGFHVLGVDTATAFANGVSVHLVQLFDTVLFGVIGHAGMGMLRRAR